MSAILECKNLSKAYGRKTALSHINLALEGGHIIGLLGPNGSGKTTLIKIINGLLTPSEGEIYVNQNPIGVESKKAVSYLPDHTYLDSDLKVREIIAYFKDFYEDFDEKRAYDIILDIILSNYEEDATILISTHLIADIENILDQVIFIKNGQIVLNTSVDTIREEQKKSVDSLFREVFKC